MSRSFGWAAVPVLLAVTPLAAQSYYAQPPQPSDPQTSEYAAPDDQPQAGEDRGYTPPPRYQPRPDAPPPGYYRQAPPGYYRQAPQGYAPQAYAPQGYAPYGYQPEPQRRPVYADNNGGQPRAPYARYDYGRQAEYYGQQPDYGHRPTYAPQRAAEAPASAPAAVAPAPVATAPVAPAPEAAAPVDPADQTAWEVAKKANSVDAFTAYLDQHATGAHSEEAETAIDLLQRDPPPADQVVAGAKPAAAAAVKVASLPAIKGLPIHAVETAAVPVAPATDTAPGKPLVAAAATPVATAAAQPTAFVCRPSFQGAVPYDQADAAEIAAYLQATHVNSIAAYQAYLATYPHGVFSGEVQDVISAREGRMSQLAAAGLTAGIAHARAKVTLTAADYPSVALRDGQQGTATASWEVAEDGCVESCKIDRSSGSAALDAATCNVITERGRYDPAFGAAGKPVRSMETAQLTWNLPQH